MSNSNNINSVQARSLWIGDIEYWMDEGFIIKIFQDVANVKNLKIIRDKTKVTNIGYGFVEFENAETAKEVLEELNGKPIPESNKTLKLNWASYSAGKQAAMSNSPITDYSIYVGDLDLAVSEEKLKDFFSKFYSSVIGTKIIIDPVNKTSKGYGFVKFSDQTEAQKALIDMNGKLLNGKSIKTNQASFKKISSDTNLLSNNTNQNYSQYPYNYSNNYSTDPNTYSPNTSLFTYNQGYNFNTNDNNKFPNLYNNQSQSQISSNNSSQSSSNSVNLTNLNNFYKYNPNIDYSLDNSSLGSLYNVNNFFYNNMNTYSNLSNLYGGYYGLSNSNQSNGYSTSNMSNSNSQNNNYTQNFNIPGEYSQSNTKSNNY